MPRLDAEALHRLLADEGTFGTTLLVWALDALGPGLLGGPDPDDPPGHDPEPWAPQTVAAECRRVLGFDLPEGPLDRLLAARTIVTTDRFTRDEAAFVPLCVVLSGGPFSPHQFVPADALECAWGITEALLLDPPDEEDPFAPGVRAYIGHACAQDGLLDPPDVLRLGILPPRRGHGELAPEARAHQADRNREVIDALRDGLGRLLGQLESLPLKHGTATQLTSRLRAAIKGS